MPNNEEKADELGWLDENGVCEFPPDVVAVVNGYKAPGIPNMDRLSPEKLQEAVDRGWIKFQDGNGDYHTFKEYVEAFPDYPDPVWMLEQQKRWPPGKVVHLGN